MRFRTLFWRSCRLRCPVCGTGKLFRGPLAMHERCGGCGLEFQRPGGFYLGSIYVNYGLTALLVTIGYFVLYFTGWIPRGWIVWVLVAFSVVFPAWFFRYARSLWLGFDQYFDPVLKDAEAESMRGTDSKSLASRRNDAL